MANCSFVVFQIWDLPGHLDYFDSATFDANNIFGGCDALIFVIDAQVNSVYPEVKINKKSKIKTVNHRFS